MDYPIQNQSPNVAAAVVPGALNASGSFAPDAQTDAAYSDGTLAAAGTKIGLLKGIFGKLAGTLGVAGQSVDVAATPAVTAGAAYAAGNQVGGLLTFANAVRAATLSGVLASLRLSCRDVQTTAFRIYLFTANPTGSSWADKTAPAIAAADIPFLAGVYTLSAADSGLGTHTLYNLDGIGKVLQCATTSLYGVLVCVGTPTFGSTSDVTVAVGIAQD